MKKAFCDICGVEIDKTNSCTHPFNRINARLSRGSQTLGVEVITKLNDTYNKGDFCKYCVIDAVNKADDRHKKSEEKQSPEEYLGNCTHGRTYSTPQDTDGCFIKCGYCGARAKRGPSIWLNP